MLSSAPLLDSQWYLHYIFFFLETAYFVLTVNAALVLIRTDWVSPETSLVLLLINSVSDAIHWLGDIWFQDHVHVSWGSCGVGSPIHGRCLFLGHSWSSHNPCHMTLLLPPSHIPTHSQVVHMNPYAALCSHMLSEAIDKLRRGEQT